MQPIQQQLAPFGASITLTANEPMSAHTTLRVGGTADWFVTLHDMAVVPQVFTALHTTALPIYIMGRGSNLLVTDGGIRGIVVCLNGLRNVTVQGDCITAQAGASLHAVAQTACAHGLQGAEFLDGIPGTVGGALVMNAGAYGGEIGNHVVQTTYLLDGQLHTVDATAQDFAYRHSWFQDHPTAVILSTTLRFATGDTAEITAKMQELSAQRREKQPLNYPSAGSTFKRPTGLFAAKLIDDAGLRGYRSGGAQVSEKHTGFVINRENATATDVLAVIAHVKAQVQAQFAVPLECEVRIWGA